MFDSSKKDLREILRTGVLFLPVASIGRCDMGGAACRIDESRWRFGKAPQAVFPVRGFSCPTAVRLWLPAVLAALALSGAARKPIHDAALFIQPLAVLG